MKHSYHLLLTAFAGLASSAFGQIDNEGWVPLARSDAYDGIVIGTALGPAQCRRLEDVAGGPARYFAVQRVQVIDSRAFASGKVIETFLRYYPREPGIDPDLDPGAMIGQSGALPVGVPTLLVGAASRNGFLRVPDLDDARTKRAYVIGSAELPAVFGYAAFRTRQTSLPRTADPMWRLLEGVAGSIPGSDDENARRVHDFLRNVRLPEWGDFYTTRKTDDRLSRLFTDSVAKSSAYHRALIDFALNQLYYVGYGDRFYRDLYASANDPGAFPNGVPQLTYWENPGSEGGLPQAFHHDAPLSDEERISLLRTAKSSMIAAWLLKDASKPSDADQRALARFLNSPHPWLRHALVKRLAHWYGEPEPDEPRNVLDDSGESHREYPGLDAAVARWKSRLRP